MTDLSVSLVTYHPDRPMLAAALSSLRVALDVARQSGELAEVRLVLVDNGDDAGLLDLAQRSGWDALEMISGHGNVGFGRGHNLALMREMGALHLIMNPDVDLQPDALLKALQFMREHPECGLLSPAIQNAAGAWAYLCKRYPSLVDLFLRGFMPAAIKRRFVRRLARYEMAEHSSDEVLWDPPIVSGCFMLCRSELLRALGGFDPRYFLYFEDFDLSLRAGQHTRLAAVGAVKIAHFGGDAGRKGWKHIRMFCVSATRFFSQHGWRLS